MEKPMNLEYHAPTLTFEAMWATLANTHRPPELTPKLRLAWAPRIQTPLVLIVSSAQCNAMTILKVSDLDHRLKGELSCLNSHKSWGRKTWERNEVCVTVFLSDSLQSITRSGCCYTQDSLFGIECTLYSSQKITPERGLKSEKKGWGKKLNCVSIGWGTPSVNAKSHLWNFISDWLPFHKRLLRERSNDVYLENYKLKA
jgi:hypothetical protein